MFLSLFFGGGGGVHFIFLLFSLSFCLPAKAVWGRGVRGTNLGLEYSSPRETFTWYRSKVAHCSLCIRFTFMPQSSHVLGTFHVMRRDDSNTRGCT